MKRREWLSTIAVTPGQRDEGDFAKRAAAVREEGALSVSLDEEFMVAETVLRARGMR